MSSQTFPVIGQRPYATIPVTGKPVKFLVDSGNDLSLINHETAEYLGIPPQAMRAGFSVKGISQESQPFSMVDLPITIGNQTVTVPFGVGKIKDNLLGREGIWDKFNISVNSSQITFSPMGDGLGLGLPIGGNYAYTTELTCQTCPSNIY